MSTKKEKERVRTINKTKDIIIKKRENKQR